MMITIDARNVNGFAFEAYLASYFAGLADGGSEFRGGEPDMAFGQEFWMNGPQVSFTYGDADAVTLMEGEEIAYDFIHHGAAEGHGISGYVDKVTFALADDDTGTHGQHGRYYGLDKGLVVSGLDLTGEVGAGPEKENDVYWLYKALQEGGVDAQKLNVLRNFFYAEEQTFRGGAGDDDYASTKYDDTLLGGNGSDTLNGANGADVLNGQTGDDSLLGSRGDDVVTGGAGNDTLKGGDGDDTVTGGAGNDVLFGGEGTDTFVFNRSDIGGTDRIRDFDGGLDKIDVTALDMTFAGYSTDDFSASGAAELVITFDADGSVVQGDTDGDGDVDFVVFVKTVELTDSEIVF